MKTEPRIRLEDPRCPTCDAWASGVLEPCTRTVPLVQDEDVFIYDTELTEVEQEGDERDDVQVQCPNGHYWTTDREHMAPAELPERTSVDAPTLVGHVGVDSGSMYIGDPCYFVGRPLGAMDWEAFCTAYRLPSDVPQPVGIMGHASLGLVSPTGYGDGIYPVYAVIRDGRVLSLTIDFGVDA